MHRKEIIQGFIDALGAQTYLEIGVQRGHLFLEIEAPQKVAVDPKFLFSKTNRVRKFFHRHERYYELTSDDFFAEVAPGLFANGSRIDVAFIDGLHTYEQVLRDVDNCLQYLNPGGVILLHDCNPATAEEAVHATSPADARTRYPGWNSGMWTGDVFRAIVHLRQTLPERDVFVFDADHGVGCILPSTRQGITTSVDLGQIGELYFDQLAADREGLIGLRHPTHLAEALKKVGSLSNQ